MGNMDNKGKEYLFAYTFIFQWSVFLLDFLFRS